MGESNTIGKSRAGTIADAIFFRIICEYGTPKAVICDEGPAFISDLMKMYLHAMKVKPYYISPMKIMGQIEQKDISEH